MNKALEIQKNRPDALLGQILIEMSVVSEKELVRCLTIAQGRPKIGEILVALNLVTKQDILDALDEQKQTGEKIGMVLVHRNKIGKNELLRILSYQSQSLIEKIDSDFEDVDKIISGL